MKIYHVNFDSHSKELVYFKKEDVQRINYVLYLDNLETTKAQTLRHNFSLLGNYIISISIIFTSSCLRAQPLEVVFFGFGTSLWFVG